MVALDLDDVGEAVDLAREIGSRVAALKVGSQLFARGGPEAVRRIIEAGAEVFLDLKFHDIPNTVQKAVEGAGSIGVSWLTVHASGGRRMVAAAKEAAGSARVLAVTVLTSLGQEDVSQIGFAGSVSDQVLRLALLAREAGADGIVCSPLEVSALRGVLDRECVLVTPGIRPAGAASDDQARIASPAAAIRAGADFLVVGRPVVRAPDRKAAVEQILREIEHSRN